MGGSGSWDEPGVGKFGSALGWGCWCCVSLTETTTVSPCPLFLCRLKNSFSAVSVPPPNLLRPSTPCTRFK